ncbi:unnamed protein product [Mytilus coruscus]|uniref:Peptidase A2 domain-containing protein n=1 Tax=Mytilus coruscus TaxID=42192 RepID=A0A6J8BSG4_MYTCO|nr:unnamed protein product [Mytilus coruscus]
MEKQADYILEKLFPLKASFNDKPSPSSNIVTTHVASSGPSAHEIDNQNKSNNKNIQNPENLTSGHVASAFVPIENTKTPPSTGMFRKPVPVTCPPGKLLVAGREGHLPAETCIAKRSNISKVKTHDHDGLFMKAEIFSRIIHCLIDTGASMSVLNPKVFDSLPEHCKTKLQPYENDLKMADEHNVRP